MTDSVAAAPLANPSRGLLSRAVGVVLTPKTTYADVAAKPRILGALTLVLIIMIGASVAFSSTQIGRDLMMEQGVRVLESFGVQVTDQMYSVIEAQANQAPYRSVIGQLIVLPLMAAILAGLILAVYTAILGGDGKFKQVYAIVVHSGILLALQALFIYPLFYLKGSMASPTSLAVFLPFLDESSFLARLIGAIDLFRLWWIVNLAIGVGVLYKRKTSPVVWTMLTVYAVIALIIAAIGSAVSGA
jgi:hypothetical protein